MTSVHVSKLATDRPTSRMAISPQRLIRFTSCLVLGKVFGFGGSNMTLFVFWSNPRWWPRDWS